MVLELRWAKEKDTEQSYKINDIFTQSESQTT